jgi:hypothetical protein
MAKRDRLSLVDSKRAQAVQRLNELVIERRHLRKAPASGASTEARTVSLRAADDPLTAPEAPLKTVVDGRGD